MINIDRRNLLKSTLALSAVAASSPASSKAAPQSKRISTEEAFITKDVAAALTKKLGNSPEKISFSGMYLPALLDLGVGRIATMDQAGIDMQLLSLTAPGVNPLDPREAAALSISSNDELHAAIRRYPNRFAGLAAVPPQAPAEAARELERAVTKLGLKGAIINSHSDGIYLDDPRHDPIWEAAQALDVPIYIHPRMPSPKLATALAPGFLISYGFAIEAGTNVIRMMSAGVFDRFPKLQIVLGHLGENMPFYVERMDNRYQWEIDSINTSPLKRKPSEYLRNNIYITTSGMFYKNPIACAINAVGIERVLFAADYPYEDQKESIDGVAETPISAAELGMIFEGNAKRVFKL